FADGTLDHSGGGALAEGLHYPYTELGALRSRNPTQLPQATSTTTTAATKPQAEGLASMIMTPTQLAVAFMTLTTENGSHTTKRCRTAVTMNSNLNATTAPPSSLVAVSIAAITTATTCASSNSQ